MADDIKEVGAPEPGIRRAEQSPDKDPQSSASDWMVTVALELGITESRIQRAIEEVGGDEEAVRRFFRKG